MARFRPQTRRWTLVFLQRKYRTLFLSAARTLKNIVENCFERQTDWRQVLIRVEEQIQPTTNSRQNINWHMNSTNTRR
jgi:hypothetical protein